MRNLNLNNTRYARGAAVVSFVFRYFCSMKYQCLLSLGLVTFLLSSCRTTPKPVEQFPVNKVLSEVFAPIYEMSMVQSGAIDIFYCSVSFRHKNNRWPNDYNELLAFVNKSDGYLMLGEYARVDLKPLPEDDLEICYVRPGQTNQMKLKLGGPGRKK